MLLAFPACAELQEDFSYDYYSVPYRGGSLPDEIAEANPKQKPGEKHHAYTEWYVKWQFQAQVSEDGLCLVSQVATSLRITMTLPKLEDAPPSAQGKFDDYFPKLLRHEEGHVGIGRQAAAEVDAELGGIAGVTCSEIVRYANEVGRSIIGRHRAAEKAYDRETKHGKTQGAWLVD